MSKLVAFAIASRAPDVHPFCVAASVSCAGENEDAFIVALLHDALEDGYASEEEITDNFPPDICKAVWDLTRNEWETYSTYIRRVAEAGGVALTVKRHDVRINLDRCLEDGNTELARRYAKALEILYA